MAGREGGRSGSEGVSTNINDTKANMSAFWRIRFTNVWSIYIFLSWALSSPMLESMLTRAEILHSHLELQNTPDVSVLFIAIHALSSTDRRLQVLSWRKMRLQFRAEEHVPCMPDTFLLRLHGKPLEWRSKWQGVASGDHGKHVLECGKHVNACEMGENETHWRMVARKRKLTVY